MFIVRDYIMERGGNQSLAGNAGSKCWLHRFYAGCSLNRWLVSVHFLFARAKRKWTKRESTPGEGISISLPLDPFLETIQEGGTPS
jgi:hypothetical protein